MKKILFSALPIGLAILVASCNSNPADKAEKTAEKDMNKADKESEKTDKEMEKASTNASNTVTYSNLAAANEALSKVSAPTSLSNNKAKDLAKDYAKLIYDRVNAKSSDDASKEDQKITDFQNKVSTDAADGKITANDKTTIMAYGDSLVAAATRAAATN